MKDDELPAEVLGDRVHRILAEEPGSPVIGEVLATLPARDREAARRQERTFRDSALGREAASGEAMREFPFAMARHGAVLRGQIDLVLRGRDGSLTIVDYKTSRIDASGVEEKAADYELQLRIYALAVRDIFGRAPGRACLHFLHPDVVREVDVSAAALEEAEKSISSFFEAHRTETYPQRPERHCFSCGYLRAYCPDVAAGAPARGRTHRLESRALLDKNAPSDENAGRCRP